MWDVSDPQISSVGKQDKTLFSHPMQNGMDGHHFSKVYENGLNYTNYTVSSSGRIVYHMHPHATIISIRCYAKSRVLEVALESDAPAPPGAFRGRTAASSLHPDGVWAL